MRINRETCDSLQVSDNSGDAGFARIPALSAEIVETDTTILMASDGQ